MDKKMENEMETRGYRRTIGYNNGLYGGLLGYILGLYRGYIGIMEKKMETTTMG